jgi:hypothetical protein
MNIISASNPVYSSPDQSSIDLVIVSEEFGELSYTASRDDVEPLSVELYGKALAGEYGEVGPYVAKVLVEPPKPTLEELQAQIAALSAQIAALSPA